MARCLILPSALHIILLALLSMYHTTPGQSLSCGDPHTVAHYRVRFQGLWTKSRFPKVYPVNRPKAEWSSLVGRTHSTGYSLFRMGETASNKLKTFAEYGDVSPLASEGQGSSTIFDAFTTPPLPSGYGTSEAQLFAESGKDKVSLVVKIVPSPDWFVGVDSLDLCTDGEWVDLHETDLWPLDAGTQQGFTFSSPRWRSDPQEVITEITNLYPNRSADAFYYPQLTSLPPIAKLQIELIRTLQVVNDDDDDVDSEIGKSTLNNDDMAASAPKAGMMIKPPIPQFQRIDTDTLPPTEETENTTSKQPTTTSLESESTPRTSRTTFTLPTTTVESHRGLSPVILAMLKKIRENKHRFVTTTEWTTSDYRTTTASLLTGTSSGIRASQERNVTHTLTEDSTHPSVITHEASDTSTEMPVSSVPQISTTASPSDTLAPITVARQESVPQLTNNRILPPDYEDIESDPQYAVKICNVGPWTEWSECSRTCGYGVKSRTREVIEWTGNVACPELAAEQLCGSMKQCNWNHFSLTFNSSQSLLNPKKRRPKKFKLKDMRGKGVTLSPEQRDNKRPRLPPQGGKKVDGIRRRFRV